MSSQVLWLPRARRNVDHQLDYLETRNPRAAFALAEKIVEATARLAERPKIGRVGRRSNTRELVLPGTPFLIVYRVDREAVVILRFLHGAQRWPET